MAVQKSLLVEQFKDGRRPTGQEFSGLIDSFVHRGESEQEMEGDLRIRGTITLGDDPTDTGSGNPPLGTVRWNQASARFEFFSGSDWPAFGGLNLPDNSSPVPTLPVNSNLLIDSGEEVTNPSDPTQPFSTGLIRMGKCIFGTVLLENPAAPGTLEENAVFSFDTLVNTENYAFRQDQTGDTIFNSGGSSITFTIKGEPGMILTRFGPDNFTLAVNGDVNANNIP